MIRVQKLGFAYLRAATLTIVFFVLANQISSVNAQSGTYPDRPMRFVVGFGQGGPTDVVARVLADQLTQILKHNVYVENKPGASGNIATQTVATAQPDGYTFLIGASPVAVNRWLFPDFNFHLDRDFVALAPIGATANALVVHPALKVKNLHDLIVLDREKPDTITYATLGKGSSSHLAGVAFNLAAGTKLVAVPYRGNGEALQDLMGQHVKAWFATIPSVLGQINAGQLVALGTTGPERTSWLPNVPTISESGFAGYDVRLWVGVFAQAEVPKDRIARFGSAIENAMGTQKMQNTLEAQGITPMRMTRDAFAQFVRNETERWKDVVATMKDAP
jgi:tripartite-type tricarboxylate transporter receptor subunit TctC